MGKEKLSILRSGKRRRPEVGGALGWVSGQVGFVVMTQFPTIIASVWRNIGLIIVYISKSTNLGVAVLSAKNHKRQRRKRQSVTAKRENSLTPKLVTAILI